MHRQTYYDRRGRPGRERRAFTHVGADGPIVLNDHYLIEQMANFNRERIPERQPHAKGGGAFGHFQVTQDVSRYTRAPVFQPGTKTETLIRFSTVAGERGSPDTWRDPRGFSLKFYTSEGIYDMVGNNTPVFFIRDPLKFQHSSARRSAARTATCATTTCNGTSGRFWVKYHFKTDQGIDFLTQAEADRLAGVDGDYHRRDLFNSIKRGDFPRWTLKMQIMPFADAKTYRFNPFDLTKVWPHKDYPLIEVGELTLDRNITDFHTEIEQAAFEPNNLVPGIGLIAPNA
jgi:catalase